MKQLIALQYNLIGLSINNFRVFGKESKFQLSPITILTGANSSGKSSLTKAIKLLKKSFEKNGLRKIELMEVDLKLGGYNSIINSNSKNTDLTFCFEIQGIDNLGINKSNVYYIIKLIYNSIGLKSFSLSDEKGLLFEQEGSFDLEYKQPIKSFFRLSDNILNKSVIAEKFPKLNQEELEEVYNSMLYYLQNGVEIKNATDTLYETEPQKFDFIFERITRAINRLTFLGTIDIQKRFYEGPDWEGEYNEEIRFSDDSKFIDIFPKSLSKKLDETIINEIFSNKYLQNIPLAKELFPTNLFEKIFSNIEFIEGVRATQEILYTKSNNPEFYTLLDEIYNSIRVDKISGLQYWLIDKLKLFKLEKNKSITDIFKIVQIEGVGYQLQINQNGKNIGLAGLGYGVSQLLPIILNLMYNYDSGKTFIIEEPESNLHPALQSQLADLFISFINGKITTQIMDGQETTFGRSLNSQTNSLIIETHSEYLIRKLQYLTATNEISSDEIKIYYFNPLDNIPPNEDQIKLININYDGSMTDNFGPGFFDEASSWKFKLLKLTKSQMN
ncbi:MAG: hypothetical protein CFE25_05650 [Chitinophagaceae bacterium BSSC1]|nr:MAG: hypothetical protein CFE25_05650 [Chitinophagaceae bacterium BSSC1]